MKALHESEPRHLLLHHKMKESFTQTYLTILSIIQAVALADLATLVAGEYKHFTIVHWLLVLLTFFVLISIWNVYMIQSTVWDWIPDFRDAAIPFIFGALELFLNHTIILSMSLWLVGLAGIGIMGALGTWYMDLRARKEGENDELLSYLRSHHLLFALYYTGGSILLLLLGFLSYVAGLSADVGVQGSQGAFAVGLLLMVGISLVGSVIISHLYWRKAINYASIGRLPGIEGTQPDGSDKLKH